jgi:surfactin synthase thioesterase subunit
MTTLIMVPYAGSLGFAYGCIKEKLKDEYNIIVIDYLGRGNRSDMPSAASLEELVTDVYSQIEMVIQSQIDYILFGHSMGAYIVYEVYQRILSNYIVQPKMLIFSGVKTFNSFEPMVYLNDEEFYEKYILLGGINEEILENEDMKTLVFENLRTDIELIKEFSMFDLNRKLFIPTIIMNGEDDEKSSYESWCRICRAECLYYVFPGGHFFIYTFLDGVINTIKNIFKCT